MTAMNQHISVLALVAQSCPTVWDPMDCSPPGSSVHGIIQARILEWVAIPFSRRSSQPRSQTQHWRHSLYHLSHQGSPHIFTVWSFIKKFINLCFNMTKCSDHQTGSSITLKTSYKQKPNPGGRIQVEMPQDSCNENHAGASQNLPNNHLSFSSSASLGLR